MSHVCGPLRSGNRRESRARPTSTPAADNIATIALATPSAIGSSSTADSASNRNAEPSPAVENDAQSARESNRSIRRHANAAPTKTTGTATSTMDESAETKTVEIKDLGERTVCEDVGLPGPGWSLAIAVVRTTSTIGAT